MFKTKQQLKRQQSQQKFQKLHKQSTQLNVTKNDMKFLNIAIEQSYKSPMLMRHGCVVVRNGKVIGKGVNHYRTKFNKDFIKDVCCCHAEMDAIHRAMSTFTHSGSKTTTVKHLGKRSRFLRERKGYQIK